MCIFDTKIINYMWGHLLIKPSKQIKLSKMFGINLLIV